MLPFNVKFPFTYITVNNLRTAGIIVTPALIVKLPFTKIKEKFEHPWQDPKYAKRLLRYIILVIQYMLYKPLDKPLGEESISERFNAVLKDIKDIINILKGGDITDEKKNKIIEQINIERMPGFENIIKVEATPQHCYPFRASLNPFVVSLFKYRSTPSIESIQFIRTVMNYLLVMEAQIIANREKLQGSFNNISNFITYDLENFSSNPNSPNPIPVTFIGGGKIKRRYIRKIKY